MGPRTRKRGNKARDRAVTRDRRAWGPRPSTGRSDGGDEETAARSETADVAAKGKSRTMIEGEEDISWRKYGRKYIMKEAPTPIERSYYRCSVKWCQPRNTCAFVRGRIN